MLLRDTQDGIEVFMLRRAAASAFAGGMYVFPGGRVDDADGDGDEAFVVAAIRECFEEAGVLLAVDESGHMVADGHPVLAHRHEVHSGDVDVAALAASHGLRLATDQLPWVSRWITPRRQTTRRFDTRFFVAASPEGQTSMHDDHETVESMWVRPHDALAQGDRGDLMLMPPTVANLQFLAGHGSVESALAAARTIGVPQPIMPKVRTGRVGMNAVVALPGDDDYDSLPE